VLLGAHCSGGVKKALDRAAELEVDSVQLFVQSPRAWRFPEHDPQDLAAFREQRKDLGIGAVLVHAIYLVNLASLNEDFYEKSKQTMSSTVETACAIGADGVVFHVGSHQGAGLEAGLERVVPALRQVVERCSETTWLLLENSAGAGGTIGRSIEELATIYDALDRHPRLGICLDSCHLWVSGYDVTDRNALDALLDEVDERIGRDRLRALHVNDAQAPLGSNRDRHANILEGLMGEKHGVFLGHPKLQGLPAVLEVPGKDNHGPDAAEMKKLRELHARWSGASSAARRRGTSGARPGARKTRG
jgi:deoxyribonuclease IV